MTEEQKPVRGPLYWFAFHTTRKLRAFAERHRRAARILGVLSLVLAVLMRGSFQWLVLEVRKLFVPIAFGLAVVLLIRFLLKRKSRAAKFGVMASALLLACLAVFARFGFDYLSLYFRYRGLSPIELSVLPVSDFERIQPQSSVYALAHDAVSESLTPEEPDFVRVGNEYRWTMAVEPAYPLGRIFGGVKQIFDIPGSTAAPTFSAANRVTVKFESGEHLLFSRNSHTATTRTFGLRRYLNYEPAETLYFPDDKGEWVQVVTLIRWRGWLFPWPEFGGVQVIRQQDESFGSYLKLLFTGAGEWIPPEQIATHPFLRGQNIVSQEITKRIADSFRFQNGFLSPLPGYHNDDVHVPSLELDVNPQPFVGYFRRGGEKEGSLFHYFALEPFDVEKQGLDTSLFIPADGSNQVFVYHHHRLGESLSGVSAIATKVMESRKDYDWERNRPVEHRPFIKEIDGKIRFFWLTTVVTHRLGNETSRFIAGSIPELVITDAAFNVPVWVNPRAPETWVDTVGAEMRPHWSTDVAGK